MEGAPLLLLAVANWSTILVCAVLKIPQGAALLATKSARGLSLESLVLELSGLLCTLLSAILPQFSALYVLRLLISLQRKAVLILRARLSLMLAKSTTSSSFSFLVCLRYHSYYSYPLSSYVEYPVIIAQDVILLLFVLHYSGKMKHALPYTVTFVLGWYTLGVQKWVVDLAMNLSTLLSAASKFAQLRCLWQTKDAGQVSALTWSLATYTCAARIFTTLMTTKDFRVLVRFVVMTVLNIWVTATILRYRKTAKKTD